MPQVRAAVREEKKAATQLAMRESGDLRTWIHPCTIQQDLPLVEGPFKELLGSRLMMYNANECLWSEAAVIRNAPSANIRGGVVYWTVRLADGIETASTLLQMESWFVLQDLHRCCFVCRVPNGSLYSTATDVDDEPNTEELRVPSVNVCGWPCHKKFILAQGLLPTNEAYSSEEFEEARAWGRYLQIHMQRQACSLFDDFAC
jgi:hypothetical protein